MVSNGYYSQVQSAYDRIAASYDESVGRYAVSRRAKQLVLDVVKQATPVGGRVLDVGCYTGIEAMLLAHEGFRVCGVDISHRMIELARTKAERWHLTDRLTFEAMPAHDIGLLQTEGTAPFNTVYSAYGTLNLEPGLHEFREGLDRVLTPEGTFICGLLNPTVLYELLVAPMFLKFHGFRKLAKHGVRTRIGLGNETVDAFYYSPGEFEALMQPEFRLVRTIGLHILYPPPRGSHGAGSWWIPRALDAVESHLEARFPFSWMGFFALMIFRKSRTAAR